MMPTHEATLSGANPRTSTKAMLSLLYQWADAGWLRDVDVAFADQLFARAPEASPLAVLAAALVSYQTGQGHLLLDLEWACAHPAAVTGFREPDTVDAPVGPHTLLTMAADEWQRSLHAWSAVGNGPGTEPLVLEGSRLYLRRYWQHEQAITAQVEQRLATMTPLASDTLRPVLDGLFPPGSYPAEGPDWQKIACALAARSPFAVITGGPGTGKTTTVIKLLALLQSLALQEGGQALRIRLAAPTGKAAARLNESIAGQVEKLDFSRLADGETVKTAIPHEVTTLHRLLGARPDSRKFRHHRLNPLPLDIVVIDEASMIDIEMMAAMLDALPESTRLILLGDKDQLASVEAGAVLGNLCHQSQQGHYRPEIKDWIETASGMTIGKELLDDAGRPLDQAIAMLRHSFRFGEASGIGQLARAINDGDADQAYEILADDRSSDVAHLVMADVADSRLERLARAGGDTDSAKGYAHYLGVLHARRPQANASRPAWDQWAAQVLEAHGAFQLLTPLRSGPLGVDALNSRIERELARNDLITLPEQGGHWYEGRPVLVTANDYALKLMNGDIGITLAAPVDHAEPERGTTLRVAFPAGDGKDGIRWVLPSRLQRCETVYAMTVHKSQGSEFAHTALVLPDTLSPILTRELIYTAVTRAKKVFSLLAADESVVRQAISQRIERASRMFL